MATRPTLSLREPGTPWPSGDFVDLAVLGVDEAALTKALGAPLVGGIEAGMGAWKAIGIQIGQEAVVELISYEHDSLAGYTVRVDARAESGKVLPELLDVLGLGPDAVLWAAPGAS